MYLFCYHHCPCGWYGDLTHECTCTPATVTRYKNRISGPLLDRIDIHVEVPRVACDKLTDNRLGESPETIRAHVETAREKQRLRFLNTTLPATPAREAARLTSERTVPWIALGFRSCARPHVHHRQVRVNQPQLSARPFHRVLRPACTIADLAESGQLRWPRCCDIGRT
jgi:magnesium chelatase family protein